MKNLEELVEILSDIPCPFAANAVWDATGADFPYSDDQQDPRANYETGIPDIYSKSTEDGGALLPIGDFNRLGNLASRELFFKRCGGVHTFDESFSSANNGYSEGSILYLYEPERNVYKAVESQEPENDLNFAAYPAVVDAEAYRPSDPEGASPRVLWKSVGRVGGIDEGRVHVGIDYSRRKGISSGGSLSGDSIVLFGSNAWEFGLWGNYYGKTTEELVKKAACGTFVFRLSVGDGNEMRFYCKGLQGGSVDPVVYMMVMLAKLFGGTEREYYNRFCGGASFPLSFFSQSGTKLVFDASGNWKEQTPYPDANGANLIPGAVSCVAYPIEVSVSDGEEEKQ